MSGSSGKSFVAVGQLPLPAQGSCGHLWLCLYFPRIPLEVLANDSRGPRAVLDGARRRPAVLLCDETARQHGVQAGMAVNAALALSPDLELRPRNAALESRTLRRLAAWAMRFTPSVSLDPCGALLLEISGSVGLFGGSGKLMSLAVAAVEQRGHVVLSAVAPTARAALWMARAGEQAVVTEMQLLPGMLARPPLQLSGWPDAVRQGLRRMGAASMGECMRLPRDGLARRIGQRYLAEIDEALGRRPELRQTVSQEAGFRDESDLPGDTRESAALMEAIRILLGRLGRYLRPRQAGSWVLWVHLRHRDAPATLLRIGLVRPSANIRHLEELVAIHLASLTIPGPVIAIRLEAGLARMHPAPTAGLFAEQPDPGGQLAGLVERLRMRLGQDAIHGVRLCADHRPEGAWQAVADFHERQPAAEDMLCGAPRPLWLLEFPAAMGGRGGAPTFHGPVTFESGPERIETGWWDGRDVRRDYHVARNPHGLRMWIFRDLREGAWYLHGLFG